MRRIESILDPILNAVDVAGKTVIDVGCGTGDVARWLAEQGATVIGIDKKDMIEKAKNAGVLDSISFREGGGEKIPVENNFSDIVLFLASLHHVPVTEMPGAFEELQRVLKPGGYALFIEPIIECSYYLITSLAEEETEIRQHAYQAIKEAVKRGFDSEKEEFFYIERSFEDYENLLNVFFRGDESEKKAVLDKAFEITRRLADEAGCDPLEYRFQSACRVNLLRKRTK
jgi:ubiquinone/menaquinone biosynthesis C-methylase UbiE